MKFHFFFVIAAAFLTSTTFGQSFKFDLQKSTFIAAVVQKNPSTQNSKVGIVFNTRYAWEHGAQMASLFEEEEQMELDIVTAITGLCYFDRVSYTPCKSERSIEQIKIDLMSQGVAMDQSFQTWAEAAVVR